MIVFASALLLWAMGFAGRTWWKARAALEQSTAQTAYWSQLKFSLHTVNETRDARFEPFSAPADFRATALFNGDLYVCGRSALYQYGKDGRLSHVWHVGQDLPPYPLNSLAVRRGIGNPELWIATEGAGALIYNGQVLRQFLPAAQDQRNLTALLPLPDGRMLLGTLNAGLYATDGAHLGLLHPQFAHAQVTALAGGDNEIWIGTRGDGAWVWRAGTAVRFVAELPDPQVLSLWVSGNRAWVGTALGVAEFVGGRFERRLVEGMFAQALVENAGTLWIGTVDEGALRVDLSVRKPRPVAHEALAPEHSLNVLSLALAGEKTLATSADGVIRLPEREAVIEPAAASLGSGHIAALHADGHGRLWVGTFDRGVDVLPISGFGERLHIEDDVLFCVNRIQEDPEHGSVAVATANGLAVFDMSAHLRQVLDRKTGLISSHVTDVLFRRGAGGESSTVIATPAGLSFIEAGSITSLYAFQGLVNNHVYTVAELNGTLVAGTLGGLSVIRDGLVQASFTTANSGLRQNWITASAQSGSNLYLGTYGSGVIRLDRQLNVTSFREFGRAQIEINPNAIVATSRAIYAGTAGQGLAILEAGDERWRFVENGLPSRNVTAIEARDGYIYIGTDNGLVRASERGLTE